MVRTDPSTISTIELWPIDIPMTDPFVVATGRRLTAENVFVRITLQNGTYGYGEMAPFPEVGGETRASAMRSAEQLSQCLVGQSVQSFRKLGQRLTEMLPDSPVARCGLETALLDALCRTANFPLWALFGGADVRERESDITIPIADREATLRLARKWYDQGFRLFKMKVGRDVDEDVRRLEAVHRALPGIAFIGDGNQGFTREGCLAFAKGVKSFGGLLVLLEQPVSRGDLDGLMAIRHLTGIPVAADESVRSIEDAKRIVAAGAADYINIKIMKTGVLDSVDIATYARASDLRLMIGGMVETRVAMGCSFGLLIGLGGFDVLDLDTPLLLASDPVQGGYQYIGPRLRPWTDPGLGLEVNPRAGTVVTID